MFGSACACRVQSLFVLVFVYFGSIFVRRCSVPLSCRAFGVKHRYGYFFCAPVEHKLKNVACRTIALGYPLLSKCGILAFSCDWTLQYLYSDYSLYFLFVRHCLVRLGYCTVSYCLFYVSVLQLGYNTKLVVAP